MTTTSNVSIPRPISGLTDFGGKSTTALTAEGLLFYCSSRLEALDSNIKQYFSEQQRRNNGIRDASRLLTVLQAETWSGGQLGSSDILCNPGHHETHANKANEILEIYRSTDCPEVKNAAAKAFTTVSGLNIHDFKTAPATVTPNDIHASAAADKIKSVSPTEWNGMLEGIKNDQSTMTKAAEMNMIQLQSLVSQRQLAVQLTTQMMQTLNEGSKQTIGNIR